MTQHGEPADGYVPIPATLLGTLTLRHLISEIDLSIGVPENVPENSVTGFTEWAGMWRDTEITIGWDWGVVRDAIIVLNPGEIRSNVRVLLEDGQRAPALLNRMRIFEYIETLPWRDIAIEPLLHERGA